MKAKLTYNGKEIEVEIAQEELEKLEAIDGVWVPKRNNPYYYISDSGLMEGKNN